LVCNILNECKSWQSRKNMCMPTYRKFVMKNVLSKITIYMIKTQFYMILTSSIIWSTFIFSFVFEIHFHSIITKFIKCFHIFSLLPFVHIILTWHLHNCIKSQIYKIYDLWKKKTNKENIEYHAQYQTNSIMVVSTC
jgi:multisubunit Na+/H+ antiporter MnhE subunit